MQTKMSMIPRKNKIRLSTHVGAVEAPLPDNVGFSVGSEYQAPFEGNVLSGNLGKLAIVAGRSPKVGISTTKYYSAPEPSEISLELEFSAYYSAREEVLMPVARLMIAALGTRTTFDEVEEEINKIMSSITGNSNDDLSEDSESDTNETLAGMPTDKLKDETSELYDAIGFIRGPSSTTTLYIGNMYTLRDVYISSVTPQFSNVVDKDGIPMHATVSLTAVLRKSPVAEDITEAFGIGR